ncbi:MAG: DUF4093 domain-containing protein [Ruminococcus sp.]|nr:DUF4093 domain-containing protein [Ruminococcus sp.]
MKIALKETVIVEGRYDRIKLSELIVSPIIETGGFRVFKDKEKQILIRKIAEKRGILVMTDIDSAGFVIRNFLRGIVPEDRILHAYIPTVEGKEKRKPETSKEGLLGVEGVDREALIEAILNSGAHIINSHCEEQRLPFLRELSAQQTEGSARQSQSLSNKDVGEGPAPPAADDADVQIEESFITKTDFFDYGLTGREKSAAYREKVLASLGMPRYLTTNAMIAAINCLFTKEEFESFLIQLNKEIK